MSQALSDKTLQELPRVSHFHYWSQIGVNVNCPNPPFLRGCHLSQGYANEGVRCWSGNDDEAHEGRHSFGGQGVISVTSNLLPGLFARLMRTPNQELMDSLQDLIAWLFCEPNPIGVNTAMVRLSQVTQTAWGLTFQASRHICCFYHSCGPTELWGLIK